MRLILVTIFFSVSSVIAFAQEMTADQQQVVQEFIDYFKKKKKEKLASAISYPFSREYPIPTIKSKQEFLARYKEVFDDSLTKMIVNSKPSKDWSAVGWRGIMFKNGEIWLDYDGSLIGVNYQSAIEKKRKNDLIRLEKSQIHPSLRDLETPVYILETATYRIRIDKMSDRSYRYASWKKTSKMSDKPDLIINNGQIEFEGSAGNHHFDFTSKEFKYECYISVMDEEDSSPAQLTIYKDGKEIFTQKASIVIK